MAKPQLRKPTAVAERRPAGAVRPPSGKTPPKRSGLRPHMPAAVPAPIAGRTEGITSWVRDVRSELRKCAWPTREEALRLTTVIIAISLIVGIILGTFDALFAALMTGLLK